MSEPISDPSSFTRLQQWLQWQEGLHPSEIDLGLSRLTKVLYALYPDFTQPGKPINMPYTVITIAGTNGKGSTVSLLEAILSQAGYKVGAYTSPHLLQYNERIRINQLPVSDQLICNAFSRINSAREQTSLTYFEFGTLAAVEVFYQQRCDIVILEVGLGGRLDAVNAIEPDVACVTTVDFDHQDWLGDNLDSIALEKAGIYRTDKPAVYGDEPLIPSIAHKVQVEKLDFYQFSKDYGYRVREQQWDWIAADKSGFDSQYNLPLPALAGKIQLKNSANVLFILQLLRHQWPVRLADIKQGLLSASINGRFQILKQQPFIIADVAHNVQAARALKASLDELAVPGQWHIIVGMLKDKDIAAVLDILQPLTEQWSVIELESERAMPAQEIKQILNQNSAKNNVQCFESFARAYNHYSEYNKDINLLVFGSFFTVSDALRSCTE